MSKWILLPDPGGGGSCAVAQILQYSLQKVGQIAWKTSDIFLLRATDKYTLHLIPRKNIYISLSLPNNGIGGLVQNRGFFLDYTEQSTVISRRTGTSPHNLRLREDSSENRTLGNILLNVIDCLEETRVRILLFELLNHLLPQSQSHLSWQHKAFLSQENLEPSTGVLDSVLCNLWAKRTAI